jgi:GMP synthase (glutamine-hydrolysing)
MKILVVDNGTSHLSELKNILSSHDFGIVKYHEINSVNADDFDAIVLSGGDFPLKGNEAKLQEEIDLIKNYQKPIFGICFGFEVIAYVFGAKLKQLRSKEQGILDLKVIEPDQIFLNIPNFQVYEGHRWVINKPTDEIIALARSKDGIEAIKHKTRPIYAVQFHPEMFVKETCGDEIFNNFLKLVNSHSLR